MRPNLRCEECAAEFYSAAPADAAERETCDCCGGGRLALVATAKPELQSEATEPMSRRPPGPTRRHPTR